MPKSARRRALPARQHSKSGLTTSSVALDCRILGADVQGRYAELKQAAREPVRHATWEHCQGLCRFNSITPVYNQSLWNCFRIS